MKLESATLEDGVQHVSLDGRLDIDGTQAVDIRFSTMTTVNKQKIIVDLSRVSFLASIGIRLLVTAARGQQGRGGQLVLASAQAPVKKVLVSAGIDQLVPLFEDLESARASFAA